jgi:hypothetical protein
LLEVLVLLHALGLDHATDSAAVLDHATVVSLCLIIKHSKVIFALLLPRGALPGVPGLGVRLLGGLEQRASSRIMCLISISRGLDVAWIGTCGIALSSSKTAKRASGEVRMVVRIWTRRSETWPVKSGATALEL